MGFPPGESACGGDDREPRAGPLQPQHQPRSEEALEEMSEGWSATQEASVERQEVKDKGVVKFGGKEWKRVSLGSAR